MLAGSAYMERHNQVAGIVYRNICNQYGIEVPKSQWAIPQKVAENNRAKVLWDFSLSLRMTHIIPHQGERGIFFICK